MNLTEEDCKKYAPFIKGSVFKKINNYSDCEDVIANIYLELCKAMNKNKYSGKCSLGTFIFIITQRRIADSLRQKYKINVITASVKEKELTCMGQKEDYPSSEDLYIQKENQKMIRGFVDKLPGWRQRQIMKLYLKGDSLSEIAKGLGLDRSSAYSAYSKAVKQFKKFIKEN